MATSFPIHKIYDKTVKFSTNDEHTENEILQMLTNSGYENKIWGINLTNRGKQVEVKFKQTKDSNNLIQTGIYDDTRHTTYTVEPAFDKDRTIITAFNVPLGASGGSVQQYLEENYLKVLSHERQSIKYGDNGVYTGVIKFRCDKREGFVNLPQWRTFYNNRKIGIRHAEQYEERDRLALAKQQLEEENNRKRAEQREIEEQNAERNRKNKELRKRIETEKKEQERIAKEKVEKDKQNKRDFGHLIYGRFDKVSPEMAEQIQKKKTSEAKYVRLSPREFEDKKEGYIEEDIDLEIAKGEEILTTEHPLNRIDDTSVNMEEIQIIITEQATETVKEMETEETTQDDTSEQIREGEQEQEIAKQSEEEMTKGGVAEKVEEMGNELKLKEKELEMETEGTIQDDTIKDEREQIREGEQEQEIVKQSEEEMTKGGVAEKVEEMGEELKQKDKELETETEGITQDNTTKDESEQKKEGEQEQEIVKQSEEEMTNGGVAEKVQGTKKELKLKEKELEMETERTTQDNTIKDESEQIKEGEQEQEIAKQSEEEMAKGGAAEKVVEMEKELKLKEKELETSTLLISDLYTQFDDKAEGMRNMLDIKETELDEMRLKGEEIEEGEIPDNMDIRSRSNSLDLKTKETRIENKPRRRNSLTREPTHLTLGGSWETLHQDKPQEGEILSQPIANLKKRNKREANLSTEEDMKDPGLRKTARIKKENDLKKLRIGDFHYGYRNRDLSAMMKKVETGILGIQDIPIIMAYLILKKGDTTKMGISPEEKVQFTACTLYLTAGSRKKTMDGTTPTELITLWGNEILKTWGKMGKENIDKKTAIYNYENILNNINKKRKIH